ncbi:AAA family ATPase [Scytonema sp. NUACC26]|uniref:nucleotide-binding protein n=1 Tax=Scytonema sp. NUACC26 TaxID=3140176 RepID=UPI0034DBFE92
MLKLVINSPKGGVGKTTIATNAALLLASRGMKVLALDLAGGLRMSNYIRKKQAEAEQFGYFKDALEREGIFVGIIITISGLSPDVKQRINDINKKGIYCFYHIPLKDIIMWKLQETEIEFQCGDISKKIREELNNFLSKSSKIED